MKHAIRFGFFAVPVLAGLLLWAQLQSTAPQNGALFNTTVVTVTGAVSTDQSLQLLTEPAGNLNYIGKTAHVRFYGTTTSGVSGAGTWTIKLKLCTVSGCGSGTVVTLVTMGPSASQVASATNAPWDCDIFLTTTATGSSGTLYPIGNCHMETTSTTAETDAPTFVAQTTASSGTIDLTGQLFWQVTFADSGASANNSISGRFLARVFEN